MNIPTSSFPTDTDQTGILLIRSLGIPPMDAFLLLKDLLDTSRGRGDRITRAKRCIRLGGEALADRETSVPFSQAVRASLEARKHPPAPHPAGNPLYGCPDDEKMPGTGKKTGPFHHAGRLRALSPQKLFHSPPAAQGAADPERHPEFFPEARVVPQKRGLSGSSPHPQGKTHQGPFPVRGKTASPHRGTVVPRGMPAGLRPDAVRGHTPPRSQKADLEAHQPEIRPGFTGAHPYQNRREPPCFHPSRAGLHPQRTSSACSPSRPVCPPNWEKKWREVRRRSGILKKSGWVQDVLRHTYASYHLAHFCNQNLLQKEMGHSSPPCFGPLS